MDRFSASLSLRMLSLEAHNDSCSLLDGGATNSKTTEVKRSCALLAIQNKKHRKQKK